jgi:hypothetical protein
VVRAHQEKLRKSMRLARQADTPTRRYPDTCSPQPGDKSPGLQFGHFETVKPGEI